MNDWWIIGVVGGGAGAAVGGPLLLRGRLRGEPWSTEQLTGLWLIGAATAMLLIGIRHGGMLSPGWDQFVEHVTNAASCVAWTTLVSLTHRLAGPAIGVRVELRPGTERNRKSRERNSSLTPIAQHWQSGERNSSLTPIAVWPHLVLPVVYLSVVVALGVPNVRFLWLMPVGVISVAVIGWTWHSARRASPGARQAGAVFFFALAFCAAQAIRSLFPGLVIVREIVPAVTTLSFFAIAFALARRRGASGSPGVTALPATADRALYRKSRLTADDADRLVDALDAGMRSGAWYREPDLSLGLLASRLGVAPQTLSQALNQRRHQSLTEYLAARRLREAKRLLLDPANDCFTVEGIARQAGFASRSVFYKMFREAEGITPTLYRDRANLRSARLGSAKLGSESNCGDAL